MRFIFKTRYEQDINLIQHGGQLFWYGLLIVALLALPLAASRYFLSQVSRSSSMCWSPTG